MFLVFGEINAAQDRPYRRLIGKNVSEVKAIQGAPEMILAEGDSRYPINGFGKPKRTKFVSCWIYKFKAKVAYLYIDERDIVDEVFIGGS